MHLVHPCDWSLLPSTVFNTLPCVFAMCVQAIACTKVFQRSPGVPLTPQWVLVPQDCHRLSVGAPVHLVWIELWSIVCGLCHMPSLSAHHNYWHPWVGANWSCAAQNVSLRLPQLQPESSSVVVVKWVGSNPLSYQPTGFTTGLRHCCAAGMACLLFTITG